MIASESSLISWPSVVLTLCAVAFAAWIISKVFKAVESAATALKSFVRGKPTVEKQPSAKQIIAAAPIEEDPSEKMRLLEEEKRLAEEKTRLRKEKKRKKKEGARLADEWAKKRRQRKGLAEPSNEQ